MSYVGTKIEIASGNCIQALQDEWPWPCSSEVVHTLTSVSFRIQLERGGGVYYIYAEIVKLISNLLP